MASSKSKVLIIAGMHHSGSSLVTHWLHECGLHVGDYLFEKDVSNIQGRFEDLDFINLHRKVLANKKITDTGLTDKLPLITSQSDLEEFRTVIIKKSFEHKEWGWKDPRTCLFLNTYNVLLPNAYYLIVIRDFKETISSLITCDYQLIQKKYAAKNGISKWIWEHFKKHRRIKQLCKKHAEEYLKIWIFYNEELEKMMERLPPSRYFIAQPLWLLENDWQIHSHLSNEWGFSLQYIAFSDVYKSQFWNEPLAIEHYITNKKLLFEASGLYSRLKNYASLTTAMSFVS